jgi:hypothetical protein
LYGEFDGANFGIGLADALAHLKGRHAQRKRLGDISFDGIADEEEEDDDKTFGENHMDAGANIVAMTRPSLPYM